MEDSTTDDRTISEELPKSHNVDVWRQMHSDAKDELTNQTLRYRELTTRATHLIEVNGTLLALFVMVIKFRQLEIPIYIIEIVALPLLISMGYAWLAHRVKSLHPGYSPRDFQLVYKNEPTEIEYRLFMVEKLYNPAISDWKKANKSKARAIAKSVLFFGVGIVVVVIGSIFPV